MAVTDVISAKTLDLFPNTGTKCWKPVSTGYLQPEPISYVATGVATSTSMALSWMDIGAKSVDEPKYGGGCVVTLYNEHATGFGSGDWNWKLPATNQDTVTIDLGALGR